MKQIECNTYDDSIIINRMRTLLFVALITILSGCAKNEEEMNKIIFLHHSTGKVVWRGNTNRYIGKLFKQGDVKSYIKQYNKSADGNYRIEERYYPAPPYGWRNDPYDYYNIWVKNAGENPYMDQETLEILTKDFDIIIFKHCYPTSEILEDTGNPDVESKEKRLENYKLQYEALKQKMHEFPNNKFILWTTAVHIEKRLQEDQARRTVEFHDWVLNEWDEKGDNIYIWDFYKYETEGGLYLLDKYSDGSSHPNQDFGARLAPLFAQFILNVAEGKADN